MAGRVASVVVVCCGLIIVAISGGYVVAGLVSGRPDWPLLGGVAIGAYLLIRGFVFVRRAFHRKQGEDALQSARDYDATQQKGDR